TMLASQPTTPPMTNVTIKPPMVFLPLRTGCPATWNYPAGQTLRRIEGGMLDRVTGMNEVLTDSEWRRLQHEHPIAIAATVGCGGRKTPRAARREGRAADRGIRPVRGIIPAGHHDGTRELPHSNRHGSRAGQVGERERPVARPSSGRLVAAGADP